MPGLKIFSAGTLSGTRCEVEHNSETGVFRKLFYNEAGHLAGSIPVCDLRDALKLQNQIAVSRGPALDRTVERRSPTGISTVFSSSEFAFA